MCVGAGAKVYGVGGTCSSAIEVTIHGMWRRKHLELELVIVVPEVPLPIQSNTRIIVHLFLSLKGDTLSRGWGPKSERESLILIRCSRIGCISVGRGVCDRL